jgi:hypothetical protein
MFGFSFWVFCTKKQHGREWSKSTVARDELEQCFCCETPVSFLCQPIEMQSIPMFIATLTRKMTYVHHVCTICFLTS